MTSGAIQHGVPTNVFLTLFRVTSPPVAKKALTPKSGRRKRIRPYFMLCLAYELRSQPHVSLVGFRMVTNSCKHILGAFSEISQGCPDICHLPSTLQNAIRGNGPASSQHHITLSTRKVPKVTIIFKNTIPLKA